MAFSAQEGKGFFKDWLINFAKPLGFTRFLDVGCGAGWYGDIIRETHGLDPAKYDPSQAVPYVVQLDAVEAFVEYIIRYNLKDKYDRIIMEDITRVYDEVGDYDLIVMGDVIEHLEMDDAIEVVNGLLPHCRFLWGALPLEVGRPWSTGYKQCEEEWQENTFNRHMHEWTGKELQEHFKPLWTVPFIQTGCFLVEGLKT